MGATTRNDNLSFLAAQVFSVMVAGNVVLAFYGFANVEDALGFYGVYHQEKTNQIIHFFGVPLIIWSILLFFGMLDIPFVNIPLPQWAGKRATWATLMVLIYFVGYMKLDPFCATLYSPFLAFMYFSSVHWVERDYVAALKNSKDSKALVPWYGTGNLLGVAFVLHVLSWYLQIHLGHMIYEGARPAVLDSLGGALSSAPLFAFYEGIWSLGLHQGLQEATLAKVAEKTAEICSNGLAQLRICESM